MTGILRCRLAPPIILAAVVTACRSRDGGASSQKQARQPVQIVSFRNDVLPVMLRHCADEKGCHGNKPTDSVDLDLRAAAAYSQLVGAHAEARKGAFRIKPGDPLSSFLIDKLEGSLRKGEGKPMPIDAQTGAPLSPSPLPPDYIGKVLKPW